MDPHHLTTARKQLVQEQVLAQDTRVTRGGRPVTVLLPAEDHGRRRKIEDAAKRKRLLHTRYLTLAMGNASQPALLGTGGEAVVHATLRAAAPHGYQLLNPASGEVRTLLGQAVVGGPLDNAAMLSVLEPTTLESTSFLVLVEVKNVRSFLYPQALEVHQVLYKAAEVAAAHPGLRVIPVLVCRRAHFSLFTMAKQLGMFVVQMKLQPVQPSKQLDLAHLEEIRTELGYRDLIVKNDALPWMVDRLVTVLPREAPDFAAAWTRTAATMLPYSKSLRTGILSGRDRGRLMDALREAVRQELGQPVRW